MSDHDWESEFLSEVIDYIPKIANKWNFIGIKLKQENLVSQIEHREKRDSDKLTSIIQAWLEGANRPQDELKAWETIVDVLDSPSVGHGDMARKIKKKKLTPRQVVQQGMEQDGNEQDGRLSPSATGPGYSTPPPSQGCRMTSGSPQASEMSTEQFRQRSWTDPAQKQVPTMENIEAARLYYLELLRRFKDNERQDSLERHHGHHSGYGQDCVKFEYVSNLGKCVFRIFNKGNLGCGTGFFVEVNGSHWILSCCHNFICDEKDEELLKQGRGNEIVMIKEKVQKQMEESYLILQNEDYQLLDSLPDRIPSPLPDNLPDPGIPLEEFASLDLRHIYTYPEHDICAIQCKQIPKKHQNQVFPFALKEMNYTPHFGHMLYIIQNPSKLSNDGLYDPRNKHVQCSIGMLWKTKPDDHMMGYDAVTYKGSSGSPIVFPSKDGLLLVGVHLRGRVQYNWGSLLPRDLIRTMKGIAK